MIPTLLRVGAPLITQNAWDEPPDSSGAFYTPQQAAGFDVPLQAGLINNPPINRWVCLKDVQEVFSIYKL